MARPSWNDYARRVAAITLVTLVVSGATWMAVAPFATRREMLRDRGGSVALADPYRRSKAWTTPEPGSASMDAMLQVVIVAGIALVGRRVLRLRL